MGLDTSSSLASQLRALADEVDQRSREERAPRPSRREAEASGPPRVLPSCVAYRDLRSTLAVRRIHVYNDCHLPVIVNIRRNIAEPTTVFVEISEDHDFPF